MYNKSFKLLKAKWDKLLKKSGFEDIEKADGSLKSSTDSRTIANALQEKEERETYYSLAREFLVTHKFEDGIEKQIWEQHCEGIGMTPIALKLKITRYKVIMCIKKLKLGAKLDG